MLRRVGKECFGPAVNALNFIVISLIKLRFDSQDPPNPRRLKTKLALNRINLVKLCLVSFQGASAVSKSCFVKNCERQDCDPRFQLIGSNNDVFILRRTPKNCFQPLINPLSFVVIALTVIDSKEPPDPRRPKTKPFLNRIDFKSIFQ